MDTRDPMLRHLIDQVLTARELKTALDIRGGNTKAFYGGEPRGAPLEMKPLCGISSYEPTELVMTARAGTPLSELQAALAEKGQCLPFQPPRFGAGSTVGGMVAAGLAGPSRMAVGSLRDHVLGVTMLNGLGNVMSFGGQVMKNVAGYDVSRLMAGAMGVLGPILEVSLKVMPKAPRSVTLAFEADQSTALKTFKDWAARPLPVNATAWRAGRLMVRLAGAQAAVTAAAKQLGGVAVPDAQASEWWGNLRDHRHPFFQLANIELSQGLCLWRVALPARATPISLPGDTFIEWAGAEQWWRTDAPADAVRAAAAQAGGHATLFRGADKSAGAFTPLSEPLMAIHRRLKLAFDPAGIFNPGRLYADL